jgi:hypothetical protein
MVIMSENDKKKIFLLTGGHRNFNITSDILSRLNLPLIEIHETTSERIEDKISQLTSDLLEGQDKLGNELSTQRKNQKLLFEVIRQLTERIQELEVFQEHTMTQSGIFISYSHADEELVNKIAKRFQLDGINYWRDDKDLFAGQVIDNAISEGIQKNWLFLTVLTPSSILSKWVKRELEEASLEEIEGRKMIIPIIGNGLQLDKVPPKLRRKLYVDMNSDFDISYTKLKRSILFHLSEFQKQLGKSNI